MQNPFNHENYPSNELNRNTFPCSFQNNLTMKYGYIYPAGIWRTVPGATYKIKPTLGLNFMPTTFPVQTRQKVYVHYFYGRDRNFWKDYKDFVNGQRPDLVKPYIDESVTQARTGKLLDYLGVPTTMVGRYGNFVDLPLPSNPNDGSQLHYVGLSSYLKLSSYPDLVGVNSSLFLPNNQGSNTFVTFACYPLDISSFDSASISKVRLRVTPVDSSGLPNNADIDSYMNVSWSGVTRYSMVRLLVVVDNIVVADYGSSTKSSNNGIIDIPITESLPEGASLYVVFRGYQVGDSAHSLFYAPTINGTNDVAFSLPQIVGLHSASVMVSSWESDVSEIIDIDENTSPYWRSGLTGDLRERIKLNAYLPRFYETVYNLYYRNPQNNPYMLEGRPEYNKFIPSKDGGVDSNLYELRRRNWEDDFLTTAVQSPQQGIAPLVGLTDRGATLTLTNDDGTVTRYNVTTTDNGSITGIEANDTNDEPVLTKALIDAVSYGISIEDIRNVNAMQKWLELNLRKGYQYKDIIQSRWGISISYNELDLPEFIGGFTKDVQLQAVTQTANVNDEVTGQLGWQAGRLYAQGEGREITHYCDEEGYIMCLITVVPVPNYSQLLPKHWFERDLLDSYQPEFNHIGFQPITYKEVCPVQAYQESTENVNVLEQTFGYQRPWYQYFNYTDEVHGQFRTTFKDFLINRVFDVKPELSESFLLVDPEQINDVFNVPDVDDDKIIGAIYHNCVAKLPISLYAQARLE